jgi:hypothetical protein
VPHAITRVLQGATHHTIPAESAHDLNRQVTDFLA